MTERYYMGIDIGSVTTKGVIITDDCRVSASSIVPSGINYTTAAEKLREGLLAKLDLSPGDINYTIATGHPTANLSFPNEQVAAIICCARGMYNIFPSVRTVIDVEGQSSQVIRVNGEGRVINFAVSEKCAAGSGRFLEIIANVLRVDIKELGPLSLKSKNPVTFTTGCAVFGESEAISRVSEGFSKEDIVAGVHKALASKISSLIDRVGLEGDLAICGGGGLDIGLIKSIEDKLGIKLLVPPQPQLITALGAAIIAHERSKALSPVEG